jgi:glycosyltransferase involved in cell wall biosynthesis
MIELKHPEIMLSIKKQLDSRNIPSTIQMIGDGPLLEHLQKQSSIEHLDISFDGAHPFEYVRKNMSLADIFVFSSDRNEGWGAVLNEAMNAGCAPIANRCVGSSELLIRDGFSGILCDSQEEMVRATVELASAPDKYQLYGKNAYVSIRDIWNAHEAVLRFVNTIEHDCSFQYQSGPMSNAELSSKKISNNCE